ncbi:methyltransferase domain-containing protein [Kozakia baliensis]|uniref:hypothetical protein n=1 Tax=Kozakia baliensis TaxID=153496 RepID=UPI00087BFB3F|nr:hypothetical protein [Kozakia baliensis]AOX20156.1 hypothetical protein A0U90_07475 [Kozakia baliensis]
MLMRSDPNRLLDAAAFYESLRGRRATHLVTERLKALLPDPARKRILGLGYAQPFLAYWPGLASAGWVGSARLKTSMTQRPPRLPDADWMRRDCIVASDCLPFDDLSLDVILVVHGLELAGQAPLLRAAWKALADDGVMVLVVPNRSGFWAHDDSTPFGYGTPYSAGQLDRLLARAMFRAEQTATVLAVPPPILRLGKRTAGFIDRIGCVAGRRLGGLHLVVARKDLYAGLPLQPEKATLPLPRQVADMAHARRCSMREHS